MSGRSDRSAHVGITMIGWRHEGFLDRPRAGPADQVPHRAGLVVGARGPRTAKRLLADYRAGRFVIQVEVSSGVPQPVAGPFECQAIIGDHCTSESVQSCLINFFEDGLEVGVVEDM